jgi:hypothetical protein
VLVPPISFPLAFGVSVGDISVGVYYLTFKGDTYFDDRKQFGDPLKEKDIDKILKEIKACACRTSPPGPELETLEVPIVSQIGSDCRLGAVPLLVLKGSVDPNDAVRLGQSADLARVGCESGRKPSVPEAVIFSGSSALLSHEFFSPEILPEVYSVRLEIHSYGPAPIPITTFPGSSQFKFGSLSWCGPLSDGSGDPTLVFDTKTYMVLPQNHPAGYVRILLKEGISFSLIDTGERV